MGRPNPSKAASSPYMHTAAWQKLRAVKLAADPLCERCSTRLRVVPAEVVHHKDHDQRNSDWENLESLCRECHELHHGRISAKGCDVNGMPRNPQHPWSDAT